MFYFELENRNSNLHGAGLYALERIPQRSIVFYWGRDGDETVISEDEYLQLRATRSDKIFQKSACRWVYDKFVYSTTLEVDDNINHSFDPNILYYQGLGIAKRDILIGDELTVNYEYILSENDTVKFMDKETNKTVTGISADSNLDKSSKELSNLLNSHPVM
jgi:SET domain-containing protein